MVTKNPGLATGVSNGGGGRIRTFEDRSRQIYSLMRLTASLPHRGIFWSRAYKRQPIRLSTANPKRFMVPEVGVERTLSCGNRIMNPAHLPIPPLRPEPTGGRV